MQSCLIVSVRRQVRWCCPNRLLASGERIDGLSVGGRQLMALRLAVEKLAGAEAVGKLTVLLHLAEEMEEPVLADLRAHNLYGYNSIPLSCALHTTATYAC